MAAATPATSAESAGRPASPYLLVSTSQSSDGRGGTSFDRDTLLVTPVELGQDGETLVFDLPPSSTAAERSSSWHFPARIKVLPDGSRILLNEAEVAARIDPWLKLAGFTREACGRWIFTWNAFKIDCDPLSVLATVAQFDLGPANLSEGKSMTVDGAAAPGTMKLVASTLAMRTYSVEYPLDPDRVRRDRAESDVVVGQILGKPVALETAMAVHARDSISGSISEQFETDQAGRITRRKTTVTTVTIDQDGKERTAKTERTLEWRSLQSLEPAG